MTDTRYWKLGIIGWPLGYSLSPLMHTAALKAAGLEGEYKEYPVRPGDLDRWLREEAPKLDGFNVTMPHKKDVYNWVFREGTLGQPAGLLGKSVRVVNTVTMAGEKPEGHNTDIDGFLLPLSDRKPNWSDCCVLLLGAGGAAQAIASALAFRMKARSLMLCNRTAKRAEILCDQLSSFLSYFQGRQGVIQVEQDIRTVRIRDCDLVVNATPMGMKGEEEVPAEILDQLHCGQVVYDIVYEPRETKLIQEARKRDCQVITGDEMLAGQAAASFGLWTGVKGMLPVMQEALDEHFRSR